MKKTAALFTVLVMLICMAVPAFAAESRQRVCDLAGLYTEDEKSELEAELASVVDEIGMDMTVLTTWDKNGRQPLVYCDDFYSDNKFGVGADQSGLVLLIDMQDRSVYLYTRGNAVNYYNDHRIRALTDENDTLYDCLAAGQYLAGTYSVLDGIRSYYRKGIEDGQYSYNEDTGETIPYKEKKKGLSVFEIILAILIPGGAGLIHTGNIKKKYAMKAEQNNSAGYLLAYRAVSAFAFAKAADTLINESVTTRILPAATFSGGTSGSSQSTIHNSTHGGTFGGGGGGRHF